MNEYTILNWNHVTSKAAGHKCVTCDWTLRRTMFKFVLYVQYSGREGTSRPEYWTATYTEWHITEAVLIQSILLMMSTGLLETC